MKKVQFGLLVLLIAVFSSCKSDNQSKVSFYLTDAPMDTTVSEVNINIQRVEYTLGEEGAWQSLPMEPTMCNILNLTNGTDTLLSNIFLTEGDQIKQVRLVLGDGNNLVMKDGTVEQLATPSGQSSGVKLNVHAVATLTSGYSIIIDFDAARSIVKNGNGEYSLKPVIHSYIAQNTAAIDGNILPKDVVYQVYTIQGTDTISTYSEPERDNYFMLHGLTSGDYTLTYVNSVTGAEVQSNALTVTGGTDIHLGAVTLTD